MPLDDALHADIVEICDRAEALVADGHYAQAIPLYEQALRRLPEPVEDYEAATWIFAALGDVAFLEAQYDLAVQHLDRATKCFKGFGNPFIHLRLGQSLLEAGTWDRAKEELARAYQEGGEELFEEEDAKYLEAAKGAAPKRPMLN